MEKPTAVSFEVDEQTGVSNAKAQMVSVGPNALTTVLSCWSHSEFVEQVGVSTALHCYLIKGDEEKTRTLPHKSCQRLSRENDDLQEWEGLRVHLSA